jgi:anti-sigma regulatory factor (Ser/Thr protein kinase)
MTFDELERNYEIEGHDFVNAGRVSTSIKETLKSLGINPALIRRIAIASYEAEMNVVMYAMHARMSLRVNPKTITVTVQDSGPGISDINLAMQEGYSTATPEMREMGFGAGMGLPNIRRNADDFTITSEVGRGTNLYIAVNQV